MRDGSMRGRGVNFAYRAIIEYLREEGGDMAAA